MFTDSGYVPTTCRFCYSNALYAGFCDKHFFENMSRKFISKGAGYLHAQYLLSEYQSYIDRNDIEKFKSSVISEISEILNYLYHAKLSPRQALIRNNQLASSESKVEKLYIFTYRKKIKCLICREQIEHSEYKVVPLSDTRDAICSDCEGICKKCGRTDYELDVDLFRYKDGRFTLMCEDCLEEQYELEFPNHKREFLTKGEIFNMIGFEYDRVRRDLRLEEE